jgi:hypothetical protein
MRPGTSLRRLLLAVSVTLLIASPARALWTAGNDIQVNQDLPTLNQNEVALALNLAVPGNLLMAYNDNPWPGGPGLGYSYSLDYGRTWTDGHLALPLGMVMYHDPMAAVDRTGRLYTGGCANNNVVNGQSGLYVYSSTNGGVTWSAPATVSFDGPQPLPQNATLNDRGHMVADRSPVSPYVDHVHVTWMKDVGTSGPFGDTWFSTSPAGGTAFSPRLKISDPPSGLGRSHAPHVATDNLGTVYVVWADYDITQPQPLATFWLDRSFDGGATFGQDRVVQANVLTVPDIFTGGLGPDTEGDTAPAIATFTTLQGTSVYVVYNSDADGPGNWDEGDIFFTKSTDGGVTWSAPVNVSRFPGPPFQFNNGSDYAPWIDVKPNGVIDVAYYNGAWPEGKPLSWNVLLQQSRDGGLTWSGPLVLSDVAALAPVNPFSTVRWLGEYLGLAVDSTWAYVGFASARRDNLGDIWFDRVKNSVFLDCNGNQVPDYIDLGSCSPGMPWCDDCNSNQVLDGCDIDATDPDGDGWVSPDANGDLIPDECAGVGVGGDVRGRLELRALPSVTPGPTRLHFGRALAAGGTLALFDASGRVVRVLGLAPGLSSIVWDGADASGKRVVPGTYFARLTTPEGGGRTRIVVSR